jgi:hypothetical protein
MVRDTLSAVTIHVTTCLILVEANSAFDSFSTEYNYMNMCDGDHEGMVQDVRVSDAFSDSRCSHLHSSNRMELGQ